MQTSRSSIAVTILIIAAVSIIPLIAISLLQPIPEVSIYFLLAFYSTLPTGISLATAYLLAKTYVKTGERTLLTFGAATLIWGWMGLANIFFFFFVNTLGPGWALGSIILVLTSLLHLSGAIPTIQKPPSKPSPTPRVAMAYFLVTIAAAALTYACLNGLAPLFFATGGSTPLDKAFTTASIILFAGSSILFLTKAGKNPKPLSQPLYSAGLATFAVSLIPLLWGRSDDATALTTLAANLFLLTSVIIHPTESANPEQ